MKALFDINGLFKTIIDIPHSDRRFYFAITENGPEPIYDSYCFDMPGYRQTKKMVFERYANDSITINNKIEVLIKYQFSHFED